MDAAHDQQSEEDGKTEQSARLLATVTINKITEGTPAA